MLYKLNAYLFGFALTTLLGCGGSDSASIETPAPSTNHAPIVDAGLDQSVEEQTTVILEAIASDSDGSVSTYNWKQVSGLVVSLAKADSHSASFTSPSVSKEELLSFEVTVTDNEQKQSKDVIEVSVFPKPPTLIVNTEVLAKSGAHTLIEWQIESDHEIASAELVQIAGEQNISATTLDNKKAYFNAPVVDSENNDYQFKLTVIDIEGTSAAKELKLTTTGVESIFKGNKNIFELENNGLNLDNITTADIDNDGNTDFITYISGKLYWFKNNGDSDGELDVDFAPRLMTPDFDLFNSFILKDIDGDSLPDLIAHQFYGATNTVNLILSYNLGEGKFSAFEELISFERTGDISIYDVHLFYSASEVRPIITYRQDRRIDVLKMTQDNYQLLTEIDLDEYSVDENSAIKSIVFCDLESTNQPNLYFQTFNAQESDGLSSIYYLSAAENYQVPRLLTQYDDINPKQVCLKSHGTISQLLAIGHTSVKELSFDNALQQYEITDQDNEIFSPNWDIWDSIGPLLSVDTNNDGLDDIVDTQKSYRRFEYFERESTGIWQFIEGRYLVNDIKYWKEMQGNVFINLSYNEVIIGRTYSVLFPEAIIKRSLSKIGKYIFLNASSRSGRDYRTALKLVDGELVEDVNVDPVYFDSTLKLVDINNDGVEDALYKVRIDNDCFDGNHNVDVGRDVIKVRFSNGVSFGEPELLYDLGCDYWDFDNFYSLSAVKDINDDGVLDYLKHTVIGETSNSFSTWFVSEPISDTYTTEHEFKSYKVTRNLYGYWNVTPDMYDINADGLTDIVRLNNGYDCDDLTLGEHYICGQWQYRLKRVDNTFEPWQAFDEILEGSAGYKSIEGYDINSDGVDDILLQMTEGKYWFELNSENGFSAVSFLVTLESYGDLLGTGQPYFYSLKPGILKLYQYDELLKSPAIKEVQYTAVPKYWPLLIDIDDDNDLDAIYIDGDNIVLSENTYQ